MKVRLHKAPSAITHAPVRYWMHNNMITINGRKMGKSYNNVIKLTEMFSGYHPLLEKAYSPDDDPVFYFADTLPKHAWILAMKHCRQQRKV